MKELSKKKRKMITIFFDGKVIRIVTLSMLLALFLNNNAKATQDYSQLMRNSTLESAAMDKSLIKMGNIKNSDKSLTRAQIKKKSIELEGVFLSVMMEPMFPDGKESKLYGGGTGSDVFRTLMIQEYGNGLANAGGIGLAPGIEKQMNRRMEE